MYFCWTVNSVCSGAVVSNVASQREGFLVPYLAGLSVWACMLSLRLFGLPLGTFCMSALWWIGSCPVTVGIGSRLVSFDSEWNLLRLQKIEFMYTKLKIKFLISLWNVWKQLYLYYISYLLVYRLTIWECFIWSAILTSSHSKVCTSPHGAAYLHSYTENTQLKREPCINRNIYPKITGASFKNISDSDCWWKTIIAWCLSEWVTVLYNTSCNLAGVPWWPYLALFSGHDMTHSVQYTRILNTVC